MRIARPSPRQGAVVRRSGRRAAGAAAIAGCAAVLLGAAASGAPAAPAIRAGAAAGTVPGAPAAQTVTAGVSRSLGEPAAAASSVAGAVTATTFSSGVARVRVWTRPAQGGQWADAGLMLPPGFTQSYDSAAAASPGGPVFVVAGVAPGGSACITGGSVAIARVLPGGRLSAATLVSDQRGSGYFDDRPAVAAGSGGTVWVAWSEGAGADACQPVGTGDRLVVAVSHDGGRTFGAPVTMPAAGGDAAFGARLTPLGKDRVAVNWTESAGDGREKVLVSVLGPGGQVLPPQTVLLGGRPPLTLPGASFYDFPAGDITALPGGGLMVAAPLWQGGRSVIGVAVGRPGSSWQTSAVVPPPGSDLLLPALGVTSASQVRLLCAVHHRVDDRLGYASALLSVSPGRDADQAAGLAPVTPAPAGPGFYEIGEELFLTRSPGGLLSAVVVAGRGGARLETESWAAPPASPPPSPAASHAATPRPGASHRGDAARDGRAVNAAHQGPGWAGPLLAALILVTAAALATAWAARRPGGRIRR
ncbi:MAG TPA: hypothetical protein VKV80_20210 [Streptosporangiaceae bacterium]|nr:hypothetical protein [Streptosporangiaceae bacterium]